MKKVDPAISRPSPFPLEGGRAGDGGAGAVVAGLAQETAASPFSNQKPSALTPTQPSPLEGEGGRFERIRRVEPRTINHARRMRKAPTRTEALLWKALRQFDVRFRRQAPIGPYVADFACHPARLVIEVDGGVHSLTDVALRDLKRDDWLASQGYRVLRFETRQVERELESVVRTIRNVTSNTLMREV